MLGHGEASEAMSIDAFCMHKASFDCAFSAGPLCSLHFGCGTAAGDDEITVCCRSQVISLVWGCLAEKQVPNYGFPTRVRFVLQYILWKFGTGQSGRGHHMWTVGRDPVKGYRPLGGKYHQKIKIILKKNNQLWCWMTSCTRVTHIP